MREAQTLGAGTPVQFKFHDPLLSKSDSYRRTQPHPPSRAKAVLQLVERHRYMRGDLYSLRQLIEYNRYEGWR